MTHGSVRSINYVLIDYENVHPNNLETLERHLFKVFVFVGATQAKLPVDLVVGMQTLGSNAQYVMMAGMGKNALDFHIAYYLGELIKEDPDGYFHVVSKDAGFDPLIKHLKNRGLHVMRESDLAEIPIPRMSNANTIDQKIQVIVQNLAGRGQSRPRKVKTLCNTMNSLFATKLGEQDLADLVEELVKRGCIAVTDGNVSYRLPQQD